MISLNIDIRANMTVESNDFGPDSGHVFTSVKLSQPYGHSDNHGLLGGSHVTLMVDADSAEMALKLAAALRQAALRFMPDPPPITPITGQPLGVHPLAS